MIYARSASEFPLTSRMASEDRSGDHDYGRDDREIRDPRYP